LALLAIFASFRHFLTLGQLAIFPWTWPPSPALGHLPLGLATFLRLAIVP